MIFRDNTATSGYCLCSDCKYGVRKHYQNFKEAPSGKYICDKLLSSVENVGICNLFEGSDDETINR